MVVLERIGAEVVSLELTLVTLTEVDDTLEDENVEVEGVRDIVVLGLDVDVKVVENEVSVAVERVGAEVASVELTWVAEVEDALDENVAVEEVRDIVVLGSEVWLGFVEEGLVGVGSEELTVGFIEVVWELEEDDELALAEVDDADAVVDEADAVVESADSA